MGIKRLIERIRKPFGTTPAVLIPKDDGETVVKDVSVKEGTNEGGGSAAADAAAVVKMTTTLRWIRDMIMSGKVVNYDGTLSKWALPEIVNRCDFALNNRSSKCYGNIAKLREVLWKLREFYLSGYPGENWVKISGKDYREVHSMIVDALNEPIRNCEIYRDFDSANKAYMALHKKRPSIRDFVYWLLNGTADNVKSESHYEDFDRSELRRALQEVFRAMNENELLPRTSAADGGSKIKKMVETALSKPQRNCDRYLTKDEAKLAYGAMVNGLEDESKAPPFEDWLYMKE